MIRVGIGLKAGSVIFSLSFAPYNYRKKNPGLAAVSKVCACIFKATVFRSFVWPKIQC